MASDQQNCELLVGMLIYIKAQKVEAYKSTIHIEGPVKLVAKTTNRETKTVDFSSRPSLRSALKSHAQYGFGDSIEHDGVQWEFQRASPMGSYWSSSSSSDNTDNGQGEAEASVQQELASTTTALQQHASSSSQPATYEPGTWYKFAGRTEYYLVQNGQTARVVSDPPQGKWISDRDENNIHVKWMCWDGSKWETASN